jgi:hypothetical protein
MLGCTLAQLDDTPRLTAQLAGRSRPCALRPGREHSADALAGAGGPAFYRSIVMLMFPGRHAFRQTRDVRVSRSRGYQLYCLALGRRVLQDRIGYPPWRSEGRLPHGGAPLLRRF